MRAGGKHTRRRAKPAPEDPIVEKRGEDGPAKVASSPSGESPSADAEPATARSSRMRADRETGTLDARLVRMVLRVSPELQEDLITISERLFDETRLEYSYAAIIRGLIALGIASIAGKASLAVEFAGARIPRGRKAAKR